MNTFFRSIFVITLCGLVTKGSCNSLIEARLSALEKEASGFRDEVKKEVSDVKQGLEEVTKNIESLNEAVVKLVFALLENKPEAENVHNVERRAVISGNPLTNLPYGDISGLVGAPGKDGEDGKDGIDGKDGRDGLHGKDGLPGRDGLQGIEGATGQVGPVGPAGPRGTAGKDGKSGGAVYSRWGRTICGSKSTLLYKGYAGGSNYDQPGGGTNIQCMPLDPKYNKYYSGSAKWWGSSIAGVEYETIRRGIFPNAIFNQNAPCARCYTNNRSALMMIPAKRDCADGWTKEYEGYLMAIADAHNHQSTFECVDESPEYIRDEGADTNGGLFHFIRTQCNRGGHCPPYDANKQLTCVVCTK